MADNKRSANFTPKEEVILLNLIKKFKEIIENIKTDNNTNKLKNECWVKIEQLFNNESGQVFRDFPTLRKKHENLKKKTKKKVADEKCNIMGTGGGPPNTPIFSAVDTDIKEILGTRIDGLPDEFGGDSETIIIEFSGQDELDNTTVTDLATEGFQNNNKNKQTPKPSTKSLKDSVEKVNWAKNTPQNLKRSISEALVSENSKSRKRNEYDTLCSKVSQWAGAKSAVEVTKSKFIEDEHTLKMALMRQKTDAEIEAIKIVADAKVKKINEEKELTISAILNQNKIKQEILILDKQLLLKKIQNV